MARTGNSETVPGYRAVEWKSFHFTLQIEPLVEMLLRVQKVKVQTVVAAVS
jgi:hypothetical protein